MEETLTSAEAASVLGVSPSSIKRWADEGLLPCVKTAGRHRRFRRTDVERFLRDKGITPPAAQGDVEAWLALLLRPSAPQEVDSRLFAARARLGTWARVAAELGPVLEELGRRWVEGRITILAEHVASERLARGLQRAAEWLPSRPDAPRALLAAAEGDEHTLGLSLVELCLRELGWNTEWAGRLTPAEELARYLTEVERPPALLALSASSWSKNQARLAAQLARITRAARARGTEVVVGGSGAWPETPKDATRGRDLSVLARFGEARAA
jgi:excisionase family DNA binding protein